MIDANTRKLAAVAYGEASVENNSEEIGGIAFAVANRARAWHGKTVDQLLQVDPNYSYVIKKHNERYYKLMSASSEQIDNDHGMSLALSWAIKALANTGPDPSNGAYWWDGLDFKTKYNTRPKVRDGYHFAVPAHNIFHVPAVCSRPGKVYWQAYSKKTGKKVDTKLRGVYEYKWISTAAHGETIFWLHDPVYLKASGGKAYR